MPVTVFNSLLLVVEAVAYFAVMTTLFRLRGRFGLGIFLCVLGVMHFVETYLAAVFYIALPFGIISPGSTVLFSGKLCMLLLLYIKEDADTVRQPIYGLLMGNFLMVGLVLIMRNHIVVSPVPGRVADLGFIDEMGWLMIWGTTLLFIDAIMVILMWERVSRSIEGHFFIRLITCTAAVLTFDQIGFYLALRVLTDAPVEVLIGGWVAKMGAAIVFSLLTGIYLAVFEKEPASRPQRKLWDLFDVLTYRQRYEKLLASAGRDGLTGLLDRGRFEHEAPRLVGHAAERRRPVSLIMIDVDHFKSINDRYGHAAGDEALRGLAQGLAGAVREQDLLFRYGGEEFVLLCDGLDHDGALHLAERLRREAAALEAGRAGGLTLSLGVATAPEDGGDLRALLSHADRRLYAAKRGGRDRAVGRTGAASPAPSEQPAPA
ncbi:GGDEF domain-containing protein [Lutibaculum baratangense]|uniref:diguanylate cyclase n=1 Tax=Lutibaculum baratangense AMV1 TaxID=631454 RepID=V4RUI9_9HYPH|nr:GGDEF domain-containing protein [Lutibaculum baratangense]ESR26740.1 hypothetical protein N177_0524 [Lutibaculum baratangense AMV1]